MAGGALADCPTVSGKGSDDDMANDGRHDGTLSDHDRYGDADEQSIAAAWWSTAWLDAGRIRAVYAGKGGVQSRFHPGHRPRAFLQQHVLCAMPRRSRDGWRGGVQPE